MEKQFHPTLYYACDYLSMLRLKLIHFSNKDHGMMMRLEVAALNDGDFYTMMNTNRTISYDEGSLLTSTHVYTNTSW